MTATAYAPGNDHRLHDTVRVIAEHDDPTAITLAGEAPSAAADNLVLYVFVLVLAVLPWAYRGLQVRRAERLAASATTSFAMHAALFRSRFGRAYLALYALDAPEAAPPICAVRVLTTALAPQTELIFPVEVKGSPRPLGRVVVAYGNEVFWPAGPALARRNRFPRPSELAVGMPPLRETPNPGLIDRPPAWRLLRLPLGALSGAFAFAVIVAGVTAAEAAASRRWFDNAERAIGTVIGYSGDDTSVTVEYTRRGETYHVAAPVIYDSDFERNVKYPIRVDRQDPRHVRLESEPYDTTGPIAWGLVPIWVTAPWVARQLHVWRRLGISVRRGPWYQMRAAVEGGGALGSLLVGVRRGAYVVGSIPVAPSRVPAFQRFDATIAGELDPGNAVAIWHGSEALVPAGPATVSTPRLTWQDVLVREVGSPVDERWAPPTQSQDTAVELERPWLRPRPTLEVRGGFLELSFPSNFTTPWRLPAGEVAAFDTAAVAQFDLLRSIAPYVGTSVFGRPTLLLLFRDPQTVPPLRWTWAVSRSNTTGWTYRRSRANRQRADGVMIRVSDTRRALAALAMTAVEVGDDPITWLQSERPHLVAGVDWSWYRRRGRARRDP